jgi:hypothetical protein
VPAYRAYQEVLSRPDGPRRTFGRAFLLHERYKVVLLSLLAVTLLSAEDGWAQFVAVKGREYREFNNPTNPVRGEAVLGIAYVPASNNRATNNRAIKGRVIEVWIPGKFSGELSVETSTADGRFHGEGAYTGEADAKQGTWVRVNLTSSADQPLPGDSTSLALSVRGRTSDGRSKLFVARWSGVDSPGIVRLYVNSRRADIFVGSMKCSPVTVSQALRFDTFCDLKIGSLLKDENNETIIRLTRRDQGDEQSQTIVVSANGLP